MAMRVSARRAKRRRTGLAEIFRQRSERALTGRMLHLAHRPAVVAELLEQGIELCHASLVGGFALEDALLVDAMLLVPTPLRDLDVELRRSGLRRERDERTSLACVRPSLTSAYVALNCPVSRLQAEATTCRLHRLGVVGVTGGEVLDRIVDVGFEEGAVLVRSVQRGRHDQNVARGAIDAQTHRRASTTQQ